MPTGRHKYYWDACIFIAWLKNEQRDPAEMAGIEEIVRLVDKGQAILMTSVLSRIEVLESSMTPAQQSQFVAALQKRFVQPIACDMRIADKAHEIRDFYQGQNIKISTPDVIHLATAIIYGADEFNTFDGTGTKKKHAKLIPLSGSVAGHPLIIKAPAGTPNLFSTLTPLASSASATPQPSAQSPGDGKSTVSQPALDLPSVPQAAPAPPPQGSSPAGPPPHPSKQ